MDSTWWQGGAAAGRLAALLPAAKSAASSAAGARELLGRLGGQPLRGLGHVDVATVARLQAADLHLVRFIFFEDNRLERQAAADRYGNCQN